MGKRTENNHLSGGKKYIKPTKFRLAYSLNNYQPVACTIISDQPFFYMDEDVLYEEDAILSEEAYLDGGIENYDFLESEIASLRTKIDSYERLSLEFAKPADLSLQQFLTDSTLITQQYARPSKQSALERIIEALGASRMADTLYKFALKHGVAVVCSDQVDTAFYDRKAEKILVRADIDFIDQVLMVTQELRRHWQHRQGVLLHPLSFHPDQAVLINRAQLADLSVAVIRCAWEMKLQGEKEFWNRIENSPMADLGRAFAREAYTDFRTLNNGQASGAVFETWFLSERCRNQDKKLIQTMLADYRGYVFDDLESSKIVSIDLICALGEQPYGKNYLASYAQMIMNDPVFTDVRDRSNANFLWFIKFERSFMETEQELQSSSPLPKFGPVSSEDQTENNDIIEDTQYESQSNQRAEQALSLSLFGDDHQTTGNVIHVHFGARKDACEGIQS